MFRPAITSPATRAHLCAARRRARLGFGAGVVLIGAVVCAAVFGRSQPSDGVGLVLNLSLAVGSLLLALGLPAMQRTARAWRACHLDSWHEWEPHLVRLRSGKRSLMLTELVPGDASTLVSLRPLELWSADLDWANGLTRLMASAGTDVAVARGSGAPVLVAVRPVMPWTKRRWRRRWRRAVGG